MTKVLLYKSHSGEGSSSVSTRILHLRLVYELVGNCLLRILHSDPKSHKVLYDRYEVLLLAHILLFSVLFSRIAPDRKSTRLNSSHVRISYAVFCLKKKN